MKTIDVIRKERLLLLVESAGGISAAASKLERSSSQISQWTNASPDAKSGKPRTINNQSARYIESMFGKPQGWLDQPFDGNTSIGPEIKGKVPLISFVQAGQFSSIVDNFHPGEAEHWIETSVPIHQHTYALRVKGDSMRNPNGDPTFPEGSVIVVEPDAITSLADMAGQFVIMKRGADDEATFKKLVRDSGKFWLMPLNPQYERMEVVEGDVCCGVVRSKEQRFF